MLGNGINFHHPAQPPSSAAGEQGKKEKHPTDKYLSKEQNYLCHSRDGIHGTVSTQSEL